MTCTRFVPFQIINMKAEAGFIVDIAEDIRFD